MLVTKMNQSKLPAMVGFNKIMFGYLDSLKSVNEEDFELEFHFLGGKTVCNYL